MSPVPQPSLPKSFRLLAISNLLANAAEQIGVAATPIVAVLVLDAGAGTTALLQATQTLPYLLLALPLGLLADRGRRARLMASGEMLRAATLLALVLTLLGGRLTLPVLATLGFLGAIGTVAYSVTAPSLIASLVPRSRLATANGQIELIRSVAYAGGPAIGGAVVGWMGASWAYAGAAGMSILAAFALAGMRDPAAPAPSARRPLEDMWQGVRFLAGHPLLRPVMLTAVVFNVAWYCLQGVYVAYAISALGHSPSQVGVVLASYGVGMLAGALAAPHVMRALPFGRVIIIGPITGLLASIVMTMTLSSSFIGLPMTAYALLGAGPLVWTISTTTLRQSVTPLSMLGRVSAVLTMATAGARPLGAGLGALIAATVGVEWCLLAATAGFLVQSIIIVRSAPASLDAQPALAEPSLA